MTGAKDEETLLKARIALTRSIEQGSVVLSASLVEAFLNTPRHPFVPAFFRREEDKFIPWRVTDGDADAWVAQVYSDDSLITEVDGVHAKDSEPEGVTGVPTSSSTAPSLMADMLDALDVRQGARVLEVGTGTGYNAALLCWLVGDTHVTTVDHSERLATMARIQLKDMGLAPVVRCADGAEGVADRAPFDRIIATCSVRRIPPAWLGQCRTGGIMVVPIKGTLAGGMLARLKRLPDGSAAGHLLHTPAAFMPLLTGPHAVLNVPASVDGPQRESEISGSVLDNWTFSFFAQLHMPASVLRTYWREDDLHITTLFDPTDGSCARIADNRSGLPTVTASGPHDLWAAIENAYDVWLTLNRPRREWFTVQATTAGQVITYTAPSGRLHRWSNT